MSRTPSRSPRGSLAAALLVAWLAPGTRAQNTSRYAVGPQANDNYGHAVATLSDIDGDGGADFAVGAPNYDYGSLYWVDCGRVYVCNGRTGSVIRTHTGASAGDLLGSAISTAPDCDGDGKRDYAIGAPGWSSKLGRAYVYSSATGNEIWHFDGGSGARKLGTSLAMIGDANSDGFEEIAIGCPEPNLATGYVYVRDRNNNYVFTLAGAQTNARFGSAITRVNDLNGDGAYDFIVGSPLHDEWFWGSLKNDAGRVTAFDGRFGTVLTTWTTWQANARFGTSLTSLLDTNSDNVNDFAVGAPGFGNNTGYVWTISGKTSLLLLRIDSNFSDNEWFGQALCNAGDWNQDGEGDIAIGITGYTGSGCGAIEVRNGKTGALLYLVDALYHPWASGETANLYGSALASGFFDSADWSYDLLIGDPGFVKGSSHLGAYHLIERF
ncbi:MAG: hypothetical protein EXS13_12840 [Planctomycetes bacterium]|nr:hypothetical protein [Planctomycetota bacterium]